MYTYNMCFCACKNIKCVFSKRIYSIDVENKRKKKNTFERGSEREGEKERGRERESERERKKKKGHTFCLSSLILNAERRSHFEIK